MNTTAEMPITEDDVRVIKERKSVELSAEKFKELLDYLTQIEDELSITEFDFATERSFTGLLLKAFTHSISTFKSASSDTDPRELSLDLIKKWSDYLSRQVHKGLINPDQYRQFEEAIADLFPKSVTTSGSSNSEYAES